MANSFYNYKPVDENKLQSTIDKGVIEEGTGRTVLSKEELDKAISEDREVEAAKKKVKEINKTIAKKSEKKKPSTIYADNGGSSRSSRSSKKSSTISKNEQKKQELKQKYEKTPSLQGSIQPEKKQTTIEKGKGILTNFLEGFRTNLDVDTSLNVERAKVSKTDPLGYRVGAYTGKGLEILGKAFTGAAVTKTGIGAASKASAAAKASKTGKAISKVAGKISSNPIGDFFLTTGKTTARGVGITKGTEKASTLLQSSEGKKALQKVNVEEVLAKGYEAERQSLGVSKDASIKQKAAGVASVFGYEVSSLIRNKKTKDAFSSTIRKELKAQGLSGKELDEAVSAIETQRLGSGTGELAAVLDISRSSELLGRRLVSSAFKKAGTKSAKKAALKVGAISAVGIAPAGFMEGFTQEITQKISRRQKTGLGSALAMGGLGALSAGTIGGGIGGLSVSKSKKARTIGKIIEFGAFAADPTEKPGDILADVTQSIVRRRGKSVITPSISISGNVINFGTTTKTPIKKSKTNIFTNLFGFTPTQDTITKKDTTNQINTPADTKDKTDTPADTKDKTDTPADTTNKTDTPADTTTKTDTTTQTNTPTSVLATVPTFVPNVGGIPPIMPFNFGFGGGKGQIAKKTKKVYLNELKKSQKILRGMLGGISR